MRFGTVRKGDRTVAFRQDDTGTYYYDAPDVGALLEAGDWGALPAVEGPAPEEGDLVAPILRPGKVICVGLNYRDHAAEVGKEAPELPTLFAKMHTSLAGPRQELVLPAVSEKYDWEAELAVVIGSRVKNVDAAGAHDAIFGYTVINDVTGRDWQRRTSEWFQGKNFDASSPIGPVVVTPDEAPPEAGLGVRTLVNGEVMQSGVTTEMVFSPADVVAYISQFMTLEPGDLIATGTPAGVGTSMQPPRYLADGDVLETSIDGIGTLVNTVRIEGAGDDAA